MQNPQGSVISPQGKCNVKFQRNETYKGSNFSRIKKHRSHFPAKPVPEQMFYRVFMAYLTTLIYSE